MKGKVRTNKTKSVFTKALAAIVLVVFVALAVIAVEKREDIMQLFADKTTEAEATNETKEVVLNTYNYGYTGGVQTFVVPYDGKYKLEVWGAQGGYRSSSTYGGRGGYATGTVNLKSGETIYIYIGGSGNTGGTAGGYNGGGSRIGYAGGGGATDMRLTSGLWNNAASLNSRIIVAGGGGSDGAADKPGAYGGGSVGGSATEGYGSGGIGATTTVAGSLRGAFGSGGSGMHTNYGYSGAGGGGWYGGGGANCDSSDDDDRGGGGGSGFVWNGTIATPSGYAVPTSYYLSEAYMLDGSQSMPNYNGTSTQVGNAGNGYAKITLLGNKIEGKNYYYSGKQETFIAPKNGKYKLEVWGSGANSGGKGGYSTGTIDLNKNEQLYINVGGTNGYNGGGTGTYPGGGASDIRMAGTGIYNRVIVAGGGGARSGGGAGGGISGLQGSASGIANQTSGYSFGQAQGSSGGNYTRYYSVLESGYYNVKSTTSSYYSGAGGGGWYGGYSKAPTSYTGSVRTGSSTGTPTYVTRVTGYSIYTGSGGSGFVYTENTKDNVPSGYALNSNYYLTDAETRDGNQTNPSPFDSTEVGHSGDGFIKITLIDDYSGMYYEDKEIELQKEEKYNIDISKIRTTEETGIDKLQFQSLNTEIATVNSNGQIKGISEGRTKIKILDSINNTETYIYVDVLNGVKPQVEMGNNFTVSLKADGTVWTWGRNDYGQLGTGDNENRSNPTKILENIKDISVGANYAMALSQDGKIYVWGLNSNGQLGTENTENLNTPTELQVKSKITVEVPVEPSTPDENEVTDNTTGTEEIEVLESIKQIDATGAVSTVLTNDGKVFKFGSGYTSKATAINTEGLDIISVAGNIVLTKNGNVYNITDFNNIVAHQICKISSSENHNACLSDRGAAITFGNNSYGQSNVIRKVFSINMLDISANTYTTVLLDDEGKVWAQGYNGTGILAQGNTSTSSAFTTMKDPQGNEITNARYLVQADTTANYGVITNDGRLLVSGNASYNQLGADVSANVANYKYLYQYNDKETVLNERTKYLKIGETFDLDVLQASTYNVFIKDGQKAEDWKFTSWNEDVATVNENTGVIKATGIGHTTIIGTNERLNLQVKAFINVYSDNEGAITVPQFEQGDGFTVILKEDGTVWSMGVNNYGQLGIGNDLTTSRPQQVKINENTYLTGIRKISVGYQYVLALTTDGEIYAWGNNSNGQLGQNNTTNLMFAKKVLDATGTESLREIIDIGAGYNSSMALTEYGDVYAWGSGANYRLGTGNTSDHYIPVKVNMEGISTIENGQSYSPILIHSNGNTYNVGGNTEGQLGLGNTADQSAFNIINKDVVMASNNTVHSNILLSDGTLWTTGLSNYGQLGLGNTTNRNTWIQVTLPTKEDGSAVKVKQLSTGISHSMILADDNKTYVTGGNTFGQLSQGNNTNLTRYTTLKNSDGTDVEDTLMLATGSIRLNTDVTNTTAPARNLGIIRKDGNIWSAGNNEFGQLGDDTQVNENAMYLTKVSYEKLVVDELTKTVEVGGEKQLDIKYKNSLNVFNTINREGTLTYSSSDDKIVTVSEAGLLTGISKGTAKVTIENEEQGIRTYVIVRVTENGSFQDINKVISKGTHTMALAEDGTVTFMGTNAYGQFGNGTTTSSTTDRYALTNEDGEIRKDIVNIDGGFNFSAIVLQNGTLETAGLNTNGQLGVGDVENKTTFTQAITVNDELLTDVKEIQTGADFIAVLKEDGTVWTAGNSANGRLGRTITEESPANKFGQVANISDVIQISAGDTFLMMLKSDGTVYGVGLNTYGQLGTENALSYDVPTKANIEYITKIATNYASTYFQKNDGSLYSVGYNGQGQLVSGNTANSLKIKPVLNSVGTLDFGTTGYTLYVLKEDGIYAAGYNVTGGLSIGTTDNSAHTTLVKCIDVHGNPITDVKYMQDGNSSHTMAIILNDGTVMMVGQNNNYQQLTSVSTVSNFTPVFEDYLEISDRQVILKETEEKDISVKYNANLNLINRKLNNLDLVWHTSDESVTSISDGKITAHGVGTATIWVEERNSGLKASSIVTVIRNNEQAITVGDIKTNDNFNILLKEDGTVWTIGYNGNGELSDGTNINRQEYTRVRKDEGGYLDNVVKIAQSAYSGYALTADGYVYAWGYNTNGQLGQNDSTSRNVAVKVKDTAGTGYLENIIDIDASNGNTSQNIILALNKSGEVYTWGYTDYLLERNTNKLLPIKIADVQNAIKVQAAYLNAYILTGEQKVYATGYNTSGQVGVGTTGDRDLRFEYVFNANKTGSLENIIDISGSGVFALFLNTDKEVWGVGYNGNYQLAQSNAGNRTLPVKLNTGDIQVKSIQASLNESIVIDTDNNVYGIGYNNYGQLAQGNQTQLTTITPIKDIDETTSLGNILFVGKTNGNQIAYVKRDGTINMAGYQPYGTFANRDTLTHTTLTVSDPIKLNTEKNIYDIKMGERLTLAPYTDEGVRIYNDEVNIGTLRYEAEDNGVVTVDEQGNVTTIGYGSARVTITDETNNLTKTVLVNVKKSLKEKIEVGANFTVLLKEDGTVWTWGQNNYGQLGNNSTENSSEPVQALDEEGNGITGVIDIAVGSTSTTILKEDGTVWSWGQNNVGQLGNGSTTDSLVPVQVLIDEETPLNNIKAIEEGTSVDTVYAITNDGDVYSWGYNGHGECGIGNTATPITYATRTLELHDIIQIAAGEYYAAALGKDGEIYTWGLGYFYRLGHSAYNSSVSVPTRVYNNVDNIIKISAGSRNLVALKADGTVWSTGSYYYGAIGNGQSGGNSGTNYGLSTFTQMRNTNNTDVMKNVVDIQTAYLNTVLLDSNGDVYSIGYNGVGQFGTGTTSGTVIYPTKLKSDLESKILGIYTSDKNSSNSLLYVRTEDGHLAVSGYLTNGNGLTNIPNGNLYRSTIVNKEYISLDAKNIILKAGSKQKVNAEYKQNVNLAGSTFNLDNITWETDDESVAVVDQNGNITAKAFGETVIRIIDNNTQNEAQVKVTVILNDEKAVSMPQIAQTENTTAVLKEDGTVWTAGDNTNGELGRGKRDKSASYVQVKTAEFTELTNVVKIAAGQYHFVALKADGTVWTWGINNYGQLGQNNTTMSYYAVQVLAENGTDMMEDIIDISASASHTVMLKSNGEVYQVGLNGNGQFGNWNTTNTILPVKALDINNVIEVSSKGTTTTVLKADGTVWSAGSNNYGQYGSSDTTQYGYFIQMRNQDGTGMLKDATAVASGISHTVVLSKDGTVYTAGLNTNGQLGNGEKTNKVLPVKVLTDVEETTEVDGVETTQTKTVELSDIKQISASGISTYMLGKDGKVYVAGANTYYNLSQITTLDVTKAVTMRRSSGRDFDSVFAIGEYYTNTFTTVIKDDGNLYATGDNTYGQLGIRLNDDSQYTINESTEFNYTGNVQTFTAPKTAQYKLEVWGAEGGGSRISGNTASGLGGKGGYSTGIVELEEGKTIYIYVGGYGKSSNSGSAAGGYNGGGNGYASSASEPGNGGGGATDIRMTSGAWNNVASLNSRIIVAGGGRRRW